ncbi:hypothetical protein P22_1827 [Propionispora sp. 2/2-37]|uniref:ribonuclease H1 domain-containing protein n=1 Tax=Propionispora sp. 2/2-37 TaxID=1677858 RepID=UPI0006BB7A65|nr:ribonuclease H family protein [Propionispora sp. 2/2-37]CUH95747.1 hypothetical protein P22_1827 [Propionispora sp. 2/2-37]
MAAKKYYAVKAGRETGVFTTWGECQKQVTGFKGALFKSFPTEEEALAYIRGQAAVWPAAEGPGSDLSSGRHYHIYVDGSYDHNKKQYSWGFAVYRNGKVIHTASGVGKQADAAAIRNVAGELEATVEAVNWAKHQDVDTITIHHDYIGISEWATGRWKTNNEITRAYAAFIRQHLDWIHFNKVAGHTGVEGNELADKLAGQALKEYGADDCEA